MTDQDAQTVNDSTSVRTGVSGTSTVIFPTHQKVVCVANDDSINIEFAYYTAMLKKFAPNLSKEKDKEKVIPWIRKLYAAEYATEFFKIKRNRYLFTMIVSVLNDEMYGVFKSNPPSGPLKSPESFVVHKMPLTTWEVDDMWEEMLKDGEKGVAAICSVHVKCRDEEENNDGGGGDDDDGGDDNNGTTGVDNNASSGEMDKAQSADELKVKRDNENNTRNKRVLLDSLLDWEFQYLLHVARPYAALMTTVQDKTRVAKWLQKLCSIRMDVACSRMKGVRNDYMMALLGYLYDLRLTGPFEHPPPDGPLETLETAMDRLKDTYPITVPTQSDVDEFLSDQPTPAEGGAFCYIAISGDLQATNLIKSKPIRTKDCSR